MKSRKVTCLLTLLLSGAMTLQAGASEGAQNDGAIPVDAFAGTELNIAVRKFGSFDLTESFNDKAIIKQAEEATGIHVNWIEVESDTLNERLDTMLFSDEQPDCYLGMLTNTAFVQNKDMFYNMAEGDLLKTYAPNVLADYEEGGQGMLELLTLSDGSIRCLAGNMGSDLNSEIGVGWFINKAWLDQLGLAVPTTADEFYQVLCAFRDNDMNGNGDASDEIPLTFCEEEEFGIIHLANAFGIAGTEWDNARHYYQIKAGEVKPVVDQDNYRAYLEYMNKLSSEGLIDQEGFSQSGEQFRAKLAADQVGFFLGWDPSTEGVANPEDWVGMIPFTGLEDVEVIKSSFVNKCTAILASFAPCADTENIEALLHWWNYMASSKETKYLWRFGVYHYDENGVCQPQMAEADSEELLAPFDGNIVTFEYTQGAGNWTSPYLGQQDWRGELNPNVARNAIHIECAEKDMLLEGLGVETIQSGLIDPDKVEERTFLEADLLPLIDGFTANSIIDGVTDESWNDFLDDLNAYGYYDWLDWWQGLVNSEY